MYVESKQIKLYFSKTLKKEPLRSDKYTYKNICIKNVIKIEN